MQKAFKFVGQVINLRIQCKLERDITRCLVTGQDEILSYKEIER